MGIPSLSVYKSVCIARLIYVILDHKTSLKSLGHICGNSQKYIEFFFYAKNQ